MSDREISRRESKRFTNEQVAAKIEEAHELLHQGQKKAADHIFDFLKGYDLRNPEGLGTLGWDDYKYFGHLKRTHTDPLDHICPLDHSREPLTTPSNEI